MQEGAKFIFSPTGDVDVADVIDEIDDLLAPSPDKFYAFSSDGSFFNSRNHFQCISKTKDCLKNFSLCLSSAPSIIVPAATESGRPCSSKMIPVALMPNTFTSIGGETTIISRSTFWALTLLRDFHTFDDETKFRLSCTIQWFLWQSGGFVEVFWANSLAIEEFELSPEKCQSYVGHLESCKTSLSRCITSAMKNILSDEQFEGVDNWMNVLERHGYELPAKKLNLLNCSRAVINSAEYCNSETEHDSGRRRTTGLDAVSKTYEKTCKSGLESMASLKLDEPWYRKTNILLLIVFNKPHYSVIPYLDTLYRPFFALILYCGPETLDRTQHTFLKDHLVSFITFDLRPEGKVPGSLNYQCMLKALDMNFKVKGILSIADDLLVMNHRVPELNEDDLGFIPRIESKIGDLKTMKECLLGICDFFVRWPWWSDYKVESLAFLEELEYLSKKSRRMKLFQKTLQRFTGGSSRLVGGYSDVFYVPRRLSSEFLELGRLFLKHGVFLEIAIPSLIWGLSSHEEIQPLPGVQVWDVETRDRPWMHFRKSELFGKFYLHPIKWSSLAGEDFRSRPPSKDCNSGKLGNGVVCMTEMTYNFNNSIEMTSLFCHSILPYFHDPLGILPDKSEPN